MEQYADDREALLKRDVLLVATAAVSLLNGMHFSPLFDPVFFFVQRLGPGFLGPLLLFYFTSLLISLTTLLIAGIPAAIYERVMGLKDSSAVSLGLWLVATILLTIPSLMSAAGMD